jgi:PAS domain S-box-containing protein
MTTPHGCEFRVDLLPAGDHWTGFARGIAKQHQDPFLQDLVDSSPQFTAVLSVDGRWIALNGAARDRLGISNADAVLNPDAEPSYEAESWPILFNVAVPLARDSGEWTGDLRFAGSDGPSKHRVIRRQTEFGQTIGYLVRADDQRTGRVNRISRFELQRPIERFADVIPDWLCIFDLDHSAEVWSNGKIKDILGYATDEWILVRRAGLRNLIHPEDAAIAELALLRVRGLRDDEVDTIEFRARHANGSYRWLHLRSVAFARDPHGFVTQVMSTTSDITDRRLSDAHLAEMAENLREARDEAVRASRAKSDFVAYVSHEVRTLLGGVVGLTSLLSQLDLPEEAQHIVQTIEDSGRSVLRVVGDVLDLTKIEAGKFQLVPEATDLIALCRSVVAAKVQEAFARATVLQLDLPATPPPAVLVDELRVRQILLNLVSNAVKFTTAGQIDIIMRCDLVDGMMNVRFAVRDTGIGVEPAQLELIFGEYAQADSSTQREYGGTGLGLALSRTMAERMGGVLTATSEVGKGSEFVLTLRLPVADRAAAEVTEVAIQRFDGVRILLAEDNEVNILVAGSLLERLGCTYEVARSGPEAVAAAEGSNFDLILMDLQMPGYSGTSATRRIRRSTGKNTTTPIVALTATVMAEDREACRDAGMNGFLTKPFTIEELQAVVGTYAARPSAT